VNVNESGLDVAERGGSRSSLEHRAKLVTPMGYWEITLYPNAGEATGSFRSAAESSGGGAARAAQGPAEGAADGSRRARGAVRRYCAENRLNRLGTLTYRGEGCHDPRALRRDVGAFFRRLRRQIGEPLPYLWTGEWHKSGHGLHAHFAVGRYIRRGWIDEAWGHGFVHIKLLGDLPAGASSLAEARAAARYLAKYVGKELGASTGGLHRYEVAQGFQPQRVRVRGRTAWEALDLASERMGGPPARLWESSSMAEWNRPPAVWAQWDP
jgi:hypothetical protein